MLRTGLRLRCIEPPPTLAQSYSSRVISWAAPPYGPLYLPRDDDVIDCGITSENAGDQIPNHLHRVLNVSTTFIELAFVNVRINDLPFRIYLHPGDFLGLGDDNWFEVIVPMYEDDEDDNDEDDNEDNDDEDDANDAERDRKGASADESKEEEDINNPSLSPNRRHEEVEEEEQE
jgi:hypothetical protein